MRVNNRPGPQNRTATIQPDATAQSGSPSDKQLTVWINLRPHVAVHEPYLLRAAQTPTIIKTRIQVQFGVPWSEQRLCLAGAELDDHKTLQEQGLPNHAVVDLYVKCQAKSGSERP
jgi:hypothetical protein